MDYYKRAVDYMLKHLDNPKFFVFSEETKEWIWDNLNIPCDFEIIGNKNTMFEDMYLMSFCKHAIISNGTFAWWAAWLQDNPNKIVIAPNPWIKRKNTGIIPKNWVQISSE